MANFVIQTLYGSIKTIWRRYSGVFESTVCEWEPKTGRSEQTSTYGLTCLLIIPVSFLENGLKLLIRNREVPGSSLGSERSVILAHVFVFSFSQFLQGLYLKLRNDCFLPYRIKFIKHGIIRRYKSQLIKTSLNKPQINDYKSHFPCFSQTKCLPWAWWTVIYKHNQKPCSDNCKHCFYKCFRFKIQPPQAHCQGSHSLVLKSTRRKCQLFCWYFHSDE